MDASGFQQTANDWLKDFAVCLKSVNLYTSSHPRAVESLELSLGSLNRLLEDRASVMLTCGDGRIAVENLPAERDRAVSGQLCRELTARNVKSIEFSAGVGDREVASLVAALLLKPERIADRGGLEALLLEDGVSSIAVNRARPGKVSDTMEMLTDMSIMDLLTGGRHGGSGSGPGGASGESMGALMASQPSGIAGALCDAAARKDKTPAPGNTEFRSDQVAASLERLATRALEEGQRPRTEILSDLAAIVATTPAPIQLRLMAPRSGSRQARGALSAAVEQMAAETIAEIVDVQQSATEIEYGRLHEAVTRTFQWKEDRQGTVEAIERRLASRGVSPSESKEILDHLVWKELDLDRKVVLLIQRDHLWRIDFQRVREVLVKLFGGERLAEATTLIQRYLSGLLVEEVAQRRRVAENARYVLQLIEKTGKGMPMLSRIGELFLARLHDEPDEEVQSRLAAALGFLADLRLRSGETAEVLTLMRRADEMMGSTAAEMKVRGERLAEALSRAGNEKLFQQLADRHLRGDDVAALEAAEILKHAGARAVDYLIERLAQEEDRGHRAELVRLLKEMNRTSNQTFLARLEDPRWFLVRNVVHILGELGDPSVLPDLAAAASHEDPRVRKELLKTAVRLGGPDGESLVSSMTRDQDRPVQLAAVKALSALTGRDSAELLTGLATSGSDTELRREAIIAAGRRKMPGAATFLAVILRKKGLLGYSEPADLRIAAAQSLGLILGDEAVEALMAAAEEDSRREVREAAKAALRLDGVSTVG